MVEVAAALIWDGNKFMICQRPAHKARGLLWEFVGGKVEPGETREQALARECREELAVEVRVDELFMEVVHQYPDITVHLSLFHAAILQGPPQLLEHNDLRWITPDQIPQYQFCPADTGILDAIVRRWQARSLTLRKGRPAGREGRPEKELRSYDFLDALGISYEQMDREPEAPPERQREAQRALDAMICKNILLCDKKKTRFYLLVLPMDKHFVTGDVTGQLGVSHLSFADRPHMEALLDVTPGSVSVLALRNDRENRVLLVIDRAVLNREYFACHPCINTSSVRFAMADFLNAVLPALNHPPVFIDLPDRAASSL